MRLHSNPVISGTTALVLGSVAFAAAFLVASAAHAASDPTGVWLNDTGRGAIEIKNCNTGLCGHVVWVKAGSDAYGCGKQIIGEVQNSGGGTWDGGWIYSPDKKKRYDVELQPLNNGTLKVTGFAGIRFLSKTMIWTRAPQDLVRCNADEAAAPAPAPAAAPVKTARAEIPDEDAAAAPVAPPKVKLKVKPAPAAEEADGDSDDNDSHSYNIGKDVNLDEGIEVGDVFTMKRGSNGKCKIKAPFVDITVDCDRNHN